MNEVQTTQLASRASTARLVISLALLVTATVHAQSVTVQPGGVVRWPAPSNDTVLSCDLDGRSFASLQGDCYFGIDLGAEGELTVARELKRGRQERTVTVGDYPYSVQRLTLKDTSRVDLSAENAERAARERKRIDRVFERGGPARFELPLNPPLEQLPRSGRFGAKRIINGQPRSPHTGADYAANRGTPVMAAADGAVQLAEEHFFGGNSIFVDHGGGLISMYLHLDEIFVKPGQTITRGAVIGTVGSTGRSTGPHLHFGLRLNGARVDPAALLGDRDQLPTVATSP